MNEMMTFRNVEFGAIRTMSNEQGEPMFCARDVAEALGYKKPENAVAMHVDNEDKTTTLIQGSGSNYKSPGCLRQRVRPLYPHPLFQTRKRQTIQTLGNLRSTPKHP